jgi:hypothetical protein
MAMSQITREGTEMSHVQYRKPSGWATGAVVFAGVTMITIGCFQLIQGLAAVIEDTFVVVTPNYFLEFDVTAWGWIHLLLGVVVVFSGYAILAGRTWGRVLGIILAIVSAVANFLYIPYYPWWSLLIIALDIWVLWALTSRWREVTEPSPY